MTALLALWTFAKPLLTNPRVWLVGAVLAAVLGALLYTGHLQHEAASAKALAASEAQTIKTLQLQARQTEATKAVDQHTQAAEAKIQSNTQSLLTKVTAYVPIKADDQCIIGVGATRLLDAAAQGVQLPATPVSVPDAPSGVALSSLISDDVANAAAFQTAVARLNAWNDWYDAQKALADR